MTRIQYTEPFVMLATLLRWFFLASITGVIVGAGTSVFLRALFFATGRTAHHPLGVQMILLPLGGLLNGLLLYYGYRQGSLRGSDSVIAAVHKQSGAMPLKTGWIKPIAALVTLASGGSAGKEGPCAHIGGSLASWFAQLLRLSPELSKRLVTCGISAGFASVFGTPLAGTIYGIEVLTIGQVRHDILFPSFVAGVTSFEVSRFFRIPYSYYPFPRQIPFSEILFIKIIALGVVCGLTSLLFIEANEQARRWFGWLQKRFQIWAPAMPMLGGLLLAVLLLFLPTDYLGLSLPLMDHALHGAHVSFLAFFWKVLFVAITLGSGFYGGIVTPQFVIGATVGDAFANVMHMDPVLGATVGMVAVVAGSSNTPIAAIVMGFEMFGSLPGMYVLAACITAYLMVGHRSVYPDQLVAFPKSLWMRLEPGIPLHQEQIHVSYRLLKRLRKWKLRIRRR